MRRLSQPRRRGVNGSLPRTVTRLWIAVALLPSVLIPPADGAGLFSVPVKGVKVVSKSEPAKSRRHFVFRGIAELPGFNDPRVGSTTLLVSEVNCVEGPPDELCFATATSGPIALDPTLWVALGNPPGSKGYRYRDPEGSRGGVRAVQLGASGKIAVKAVGDDWPLVPTGGGTGIHVRLTRNSDYCADFGGDHRRNQAGWVSHGRTSPSSNCGGACGNGVVENGEGCDPPNGTTCDASCRSTCGEDPGSTLVACSSSDDHTVDIAGDGDHFVVAYTQAAPEFRRARAVRFDADGLALDAPPIALSDGVTAASAALAVVDDAGFYTLWSSASDTIGHRRRVPFTGPPLAIEPLLTNPPPSGGMCDAHAGGPFGIGATLASVGLHYSYAVIAPCLGGWLAGVPGAGIDPINGIADAAPASFARADTAVAAVWSRVVISPLSRSLQANRIEPSPLAAPLQLTTVPSNAGLPVVAATDDLFMTVWATPTQVRGLRFRFPGTLLDLNGGFLIANASGSMGLPAVASDGARFIVAWRDRTGALDEVRAVHVGIDGVVVEPAPVLVAAADTIVDLGLAAGTGAAWVAFSSEEPSGAHAVRIAPVPN